MYYDVVTITHFSDIFSVGQWNDYQNQMDSFVHSSDELRKLYHELHGLLLSSKAKNTQRSYKYAFNLWCKWAKTFSISPLPAKKLHISLYLVHLTESANSVSKLDEAICGIAWAHKLAGFNDPCKDDLISSVREGAHRKIGHSVVKKEPITSAILQQIVHKYAYPTCNLKDIRIACMCLLSYAGFLRFSELANLRRSDIKFYSSHIVLHLEKSKTDIYREGKDVFIAKTGSITCPVDLLQRYLNLANFSENSTEFLFRSLSFCKSSNTYKLRNSGPISYTRAREILLDTLESIGLDKSKFGLHSLRAGGATAAANAGIDDRLFKKHGRWKSDKAKDGYVKENTSVKLSVSKNLGL